MTDTSFHEATYPPTSRIRPLAGVIERARAIVSAPFQLAPQVDGLTLDEREAARRGALARLIILSLTVIQALGIPAAIFNQTPPTLLLFQVIGVGMGALCLGLNQVGRTTLAGALYVFPAIASVFGGALVSASLSPHGALDMRTALICSLQVVFILLAGLVLPLRMLWPTALGIIALMVASLLIAPLPHEADATNQLALLIVFLGIVYLATAALSWIAARSARAGMEAVDRALEREREMTILKDLFITDANHELRTPIMALYNDVKIVSRLGEHAQAETRDRILNRALGAGETLLQTLNTVLDARMLDSDAALKLDLQPIAIAPVIRQVLETFDPREVGEHWLAGDEGQRTRDIIVEAPADLVALADPVRLRQILVNLIANALKYSEPGTAIRISAARELPPARQRQRVTGQLGDASGIVTIRVQDYGLGIPPQDIPKLFNRFVRLPRDIAGSVRGTGLGLYMCKRLTQAMGGTIWVESSGVAGEGSTFSFTLRAASQTSAT